MSTPQDTSQTLETVAIEKICLNPNQPRKIFDPHELQNLSDSILAVGLIHPPLVRPINHESYELVSGERRLQACKLAGLTHILVHIQENSIERSAEVALIENIQRVDLNPLEIAKALEQLIREFHFNQEELAQRIGKKRSTVTNYLRLLTLPKNIQQSVLNAQISMGHAKAILSLDTTEKQNLLHELILRDDLNVRKAEETALRINQKSKRKQLTYTERNFFLEEIAEKIQTKLGTKVHIQGKGKHRGRISIDYYNLDDLDRLLSLFLHE
ncbi:MAG: ParB/RepB/Spo0J family partition protein [Parachlamydiaceae bacterium]